MTVRRALWLGLATLIILVSARDAGAGPPTDQLKGAIERVVTTLDNPALKGEGKVLGDLGLHDDSARSCLRPG